MVSAVLLSVFVIGLVAAGLWGMRRTASVGDFVLGGRSVGPWASAFAYGTTYFSAVLFVGFAGKLGWVFGPAALWIAAGNTLIGALGAWLILGARTRAMTHWFNAMTMPEFLARRFDAPWLSLASALIIFVFLIPYSASVFKGLGYLFQATFSIRYEHAVASMILVTGLYLVLGGYFAVALTDLIQGVVMLAGCGVLLGVLLAKAGGIGAAFATAAAHHARHTADAPRPAALLLPALVFMTSFGVWGMPQMVQKLYAVRDGAAIGRAAVVSTVFALVISFTAYTTGALAHVFFTPETLPMGPRGIAFDAIIPNLLKTQLPEPLMAVILLLVLSASMSTLSSLVLVSASAIVVDLFRSHESPQGGRSAGLPAIRAASGAFMLLSLATALYSFDVIVTLMAMSWGAIAGAFMAPFLLGLYWKRCTAAGVGAGMAAALTVQIGGYALLGSSYDRFSPIVASAAMLVPFAVVPLVSLATRPPNASVLSAAFGTTPAAAAFSGELSRP